MGAYNKRWQKENPLNVSDYRKRYRNTKGGILNHRAYIGRDKVKNPLKYKARKLVYVEVRAGRLVAKPCTCGSVNSEAHHKDYSKPLDVTWLCPKCHAREHRSKCS